jgi:Carboxypeptidase Taq (M32) metallopeptidase
MTSMMITGGSVRCSQEIWVSLSTAHDFITIFLCSLTFSLSLLPVYVIFSTGALGYFPSYTLGAMMAAQLYETAKKEIPELEKKIEKV